MSEADEVAASLARLAKHSEIHSYSDALMAVRRELPGESETVISNVAWSLWINQDQFVQTN